MEVLRIPLLIFGGVCLLALAMTIIVGMGYSSRLSFTKKMALKKSEWDTIRAAVVIFWIMMCVVVLAGIILLFDKNELPDGIYKKAGKVLVICGLAALCVCVLVGLGYITYMAFSTQETGNVHVSRANINDHEWNLMRTTNVIFWVMLAGGIILALVYAKDWLPAVMKGFD